MCASVRVAHCSAASVASALLLQRCVGGVGAATATLPRAVQRCGRNQHSRRIKSVDGLYACVAQARHAQFDSTGDRTKPYSPIEKLQKVHTTTCQAS